jgi:hypothetical protein
MPDDHPNLSTTASQRLMDDEIEHYSIKVNPSDTDRDLLEKLVTSGNAKTIAIAKLRRAQTKMIAEVSKIPTAEQFESVSVMTASHERRFQRFDEICGRLLKKLDEVWADTKEIIYKALKNAFILVLTSIFVFFIYKLITHAAPSIHLDKPAVSIGE